MVAPQAVHSLHTLIAGMQQTKIRKTAPAERCERSQACQRACSRAAGRGALRSAERAALWVCTTGCLSWARLLRFQVDWLSVR